MPRLTLRVLAIPGLALALLASNAEAGVGDMSGAALRPLARLSPLQRAQTSDCWYDNGWDGPGYYPCGDEWSGRTDGPTSSIVTPSFWRHRRYPVVIVHPKPHNSNFPRPTQRWGAQPSGSLGTPSLHRFGAASVPVAPGFRAGAATVAPGLAGIGAASRHQFRPVGIPRIGFPAAPGLAGGGLHGVGGAGSFRGAGVPRVGAVTRGVASPAIPAGSGRH